MWYQCCFITAMFHTGLVIIECEMVLIRAGVDGHLCLVIRVMEATELLHS